MDKFILHSPQPCPEPKEYTLEYVKSNSAKCDIHPSWYKLCEKQTKDEVLNILKKHLYESGEYTLHFNSSKGPIRRKSNQNFFSGWLTLKDENIVGGTAPVGMVCFDYFDDTFERYDFKNFWPEIDCEKEVINATAQFVVVGENLMPSHKENTIICGKSAECFIKRLYKSVDYPLKIACDYPDVIFEICYDGKPDKSLIADTFKIIEDYVVKYNKRHKDEIHNVADVTDITKKKKSNAVYIHVDFGNCNIDVLALVIKAISKSNLPIKEMTLK